MSTNYFSSNFTLGILGGGQLGKMLLQETRKWDIQTKVLDPSPDAPSRLACNHFEQGNLMDYETVFNFGKTVDLLTIEIENVNIDALDQLEKEGLPIFPKPQNLRIIQSKARQKHFYIDHDIPTAPFSHFAYLEELKHSIEHSTLEFPFVWKNVAPKC